MARPNPLPPLAKHLIEVGIFIGALAGLLLAPLLLLGWAMSDPVYEQQQRHLERGRARLKEERFAAARAEFEASLALRTDVYGVLGVARCTDRLGDYRSALTHFDRAIAMSPGWYQPYMERADCIERNEDAAAVTAWYSELEQREGDIATFRYLLGYHHMQHGRPSEALPALRTALDAVMARQRVRFDDDEQLGPASRIAAMEQNDLADLWPKPTYIAECYLAAEQLEEAYRWATRGVSLHQHLERSKGYSSPARIDAGDTDCRLLRARIHMERAEWAAAEEELAHARAFTDTWSARRCTEFAGELAERRARAPR